MSDPERSEQHRKWHQQLRITLWTLIIPPTAWAAHFLFSYLWAAISCAKTGRFATFPVLFVGGTVMALLVILFSGWLAWHKERTPGDPPPHEDSTEVDRLRFLGKATLLLAGLSFVGVVFTALPVIFIGDCQ
ncbi:membrane protein [Novosphingobium malaysiense]|uniref:Membrane protein n=1 Tax=Novosphingobium malaysiense TaxID=1348853 RepID=A0A0B1ZPC7_9SPHN|nr:membrane protein [Novosphingobium malaysiense]KHK91109.1 membrane protein [Novosphingobium malaysiense]